VIVIGRSEHFTSEHRPEKILCLKSETWKADSDSVEVMYLSPFDSKDIETFCGQFDEQTSKYEESSEEDEDGEMESEKKSCFEEVSRGFRTS